MAKSFICARSFHVFTIGKVLDCMHMVAETLINFANIRHKSYIRKSYLREHDIYFIPVQYVVTTSSGLSNLQKSFTRTPVFTFVRFQRNTSSSYHKKISKFSIFGNFYQEFYYLIPSTMSH